MRRSPKPIVSRVRAESFTRATREQPAAPTAPDHGLRCHAGAGGCAVSGRRACLVWRVTLENSAGQIVESRLAPVFATLPPDRVDRASVRLNPRAYRWPRAPPDRNRMRGVANGSGAGHGRLRQRAPAREREIAGVRITTVPVSQPGLFDRRADRARAAGAAANSEADRAAAERLRTITDERSRLCRTRALAARARAVAMLPGIDGHLLSSAFIEQLLPDRGAADGAAAHHALSEWRRQCSQSRAVFDSANHPAGGRTAVRGTRVRAAVTNRAGGSGVSPRRCARRRADRAGGHALGRAADPFVARRRHAGRPPGRRPGA